MGVEAEGGGVGGVTFWLWYVPLCLFTLAAMASVFPTKLRRAAAAERQAERRREQYRHDLRSEAEWQLAVEAEMGRIRQGQEAEA